MLQCKWWNLVGAFLMCSALLVAEEECCQPFSFQASLIYWQVQAEATDYVERTSSRENHTQLIPPKFNYDPGFKIGAGYTFCDCWHLNAEWTHLHTRASVKSRSEEAREKINWKFDYDTFDLLLDRRICISECFSLSPFIGLRAAWIKPNGHFSEREFGIEEQGSETTIYKYKNKLWGIGGTAGLGAEWNLGCGVSIFGKGALSQLLGNWDNREIEIQYGDDDDHSYSSYSYKSNRAFTCLGSSFGVNWDTNLFCDYQVNFQLAWETNTYLNIMNYEGYDYGDLNLHGVTFTALVKF